MTEAEWLSCTDPQKMLEHVRGQASARKLRLFACACCRRIWHLLTDQTNREAVELSERYADGMATDQEVMAKADRMLDVAWGWDRQLAAYYATNPCFDGGYCRGGFLATSPYDWTAAVSCAHEASGNVTGGHTPVLEEVITEESNQARLVRDIFGNPSRPVTVDPTWLTPTVQQLDIALYEERTFDRLPILADALEDAGCTDLDILAHCRGKGPHARGCWVVDLLLGKE
jgi:hypothetical protein